MIEETERAVAEQKVIDEPVTVVISQRGWVRARGGHGHDAQQFSFKSGDALYGAFECRTTDHVLAFGSNGRVYSVSVALLPGARGDGVPLTSLMELEDGTRLLHYFAGTADTPLLMASTAGYGFKAKAGDMHSRQKGGKSFITLDAGDEPLMPSVIGKAASAIACLSESGRLLVFGMDEIKMQPGGGRGVILIDLEKNEKLVAAQAISQKGVRVIGISSRAAKPQEISLSAAALAPHIGKRARKGRALATRMKASQLQAIG